MRWPSLPRGENRGGGGAYVSSSDPSSSTTDESLTSNGGHESFRKLNGNGNIFNNNNNEKEYSKTAADSDGSDSVDNNYEDVPNLSNEKRIFNRNRNIYANRYVLEGLDLPVRNQICQKSNLSEIKFVRNQMWLKSNLSEIKFVKN